MDADYGDDYFCVLTGYDDYLLDVSTSDGETYSTDDSSVVTDPPTDGSYWHHYHLLVPVSSRSSTLSTEFFGSPNWGASNPAIDNVTISAYSDPNQTKRMALSRSPISLGQVRVGSHKGDTLKVSSFDTDPITVSSSMKTGTLFSRYPTSANRTINAGTSEIDSVIFAPTSRGTFSDSLIFTSNSDELSEQRMSVYVSGQGVQAIFNSTNGNAVAFGNLRVGRTALRTFAFSNSGDDTLFLQTPTISDSGFSIVSGPASLT
ncbi:MAG: choice-of-anchor D domain-containing protein, partial [Candidatus Kapaibacterium sp.]